MNAEIGGSFAKKNPILTPKQGRDGFVTGKTKYSSVIFFFFRCCIFFLIEAGFNLWDLFGILRPKQFEIFFFLKSQRGNFMVQV